MARARARESDPASELAGLETRLSGGELARGYVVRGEERYFRERAIERLKRKAEESGHELCLHEAASPEFQLARLVDDLGGGGLFAARRLIVVRDVAGLLRKGEGGESPFVRAAKAFLASGDEPGTLVLSDGSLRADNPLVKAVVAAGGAVLGFRKLWDSPPPWKPDPRATELVQWTERRARELGVRLNTDQALFVAAATGNDLAALDDQLVALRAGGGKALREVVQWTAGGSPWNVADRILEGDLARALGGIEGLFRGGFQEKSGRRLVDAAGIASLLVGALQKGIRSAIDLSRSGGGTAEREGGNAFQKAALARARLRRHDEWRALLEDAAALERAAKSGVGIDASDFARVALRWRVERSGARR
jgi:hypothetical protein